jgi:hypothetical protein
MVEKPGQYEPPFRYRCLAPIIVRAMRALPGYNVEVDYTGDPVEKKDYFHFTLLNYAMTILISGLLFLYLKEKLGPLYAYAGSLLYLFSFYTVVINYIPMGDTACQLAVMVCVLLIERRKPFWFTLACLIGVFAKETLLVVMIPWIFSQALGNRDWRRLRYLLYMLPGALAYLAATRMFPAKAGYDYYTPGFVLRRVFEVFLPSTWNASLVFHVLVAQTPLWAAFGLYFWMKRNWKTPLPRLNPELLVFPFLIWLGIAIDINNSTGRVSALSFPALILFQAGVVKAWVDGFRRPYQPTNAASLQPSV